MAESRSDAARHESRRGWFVLATLLVAMVWAAASIRLHLGYVTAAGLVATILLLDLAFIARYCDRLLAKLLVMSLVAGWVELLADRWLVLSTSTLAYWPGGPFVLESPLYMPFGWAGAIFQLSYIGLWLWKRLTPPLACLAAGLIGAVNIPLYEHCARAAGWWHYSNTLMLGNVPYYIILGDLIAIGTLPLWAKASERLGWGWSAFLGALLGLELWACFVLGLGIFGIVG